jgi:DNA-binding transcriptional regulator/RsmH inhibitor MraZ
MLGMGSRFEIWDEDTLIAQREEEVASFNEQASEEMANLVL